MGLLEIAISWLAGFASGAITLYLFYLMRRSKVDEWNDRRIDDSWQKWSSLHDEKTDKQG